MSRDEVVTILNNNDEGRALFSMLAIWGRLLTVAYVGSSGRMIFEPFFEFSTEDMEIPSYGVPA